MVTSTDDVNDAASMAKHVDAEYPVLADPTQAIAKSYEVFDLLKDGVATPSVFVIGQGRTIQWKHIGRRTSDRPSAGRILEVVLGFSKV